MYFCRTYFLAMPVLGKVEGMAQELPIQTILPAARETLAQQNTLILQAPPGAGKSTVLPLALLNEPWLTGQKVLMLEPRRLAARAVASRMAQLLGEDIGQTIGYRVRFDNRIGKNTRLEVLTEGILTRMLGQDNTLEGVGLVIFDEFHERSLQADLCLALCREVQRVLREDLRLVIMSATLDGAELSALLGNAPVLSSSGRQYPVDLRYVPQEQRMQANSESIVQQVTQTVRKSLKEAEGDVLVFLPGVGEIRKVEERLQVHEPEVSVHTLYGDLSLAAQQASLMPDPQGKRKVVLATAIAETSLTIEGVQVVVDSGYARVARFDPRSGLTRLETIPLTRATADQRAGRAGRLGPGVAYRLWSERLHQHLQAHTQPEILEADLAPVLLELAGWGITDINMLSWLTPPPAGAVAAAQELLNQLGALQKGRITEKGKQMLRLPTHPRLAQLLLEGKAAGLTPLAAELAALLEERDPLAREAGADLTLRIETLRRWRRGGVALADSALLQRIDKLVYSWCKLLNVSPDSKMVADTAVGKLLAAAYPERIAKQEQKGGRYRLSNGRTARLPEGDPLVHSEWIAIAHMDAGKVEGRIFLAAPLDPDDVRSLATAHEVIGWDSEKAILLARLEMRLGDILVRTKPLPAIPEDQRIGILCEVLSKEGERLLTWTEEVQQWQARVLSLRHWRPTEDWPDVQTATLLQQVGDWLPPYLQNVRNGEDLKRLDLLAILQSSLSWSLQQQLVILAPKVLEVPTGSHIKLEYKKDGTAPVLAVRLQEMFGLLETPRINDGRTPVLLHLLSPGYRPVQVTQDLHSFWQNTYAAVRKDLRGRYPKHHWPEDPWTAEAVRGVKRKK